MANLKQITKKAVERFDEEFVVGDTNMLYSFVNRKNIGNFLTQAIEEAVRSALESTRIEKRRSGFGSGGRAGWREIHQSNTNGDFNQAVAEQEQKVKEFLK